MSTEGRSNDVTNGPPPGDAPASKPERANGGRSMLSQQTPITLGLVIVLVSMVAGCVAGYITLQVQVSATCDVVATLDDQYVPREVVEEKLDRINERQARMERTLDAVANKVGAQ